MCWRKGFQNQRRDQKRVSELAIGVGRQGTDLAWGQTIRSWKGNVGVTQVKSGYIAVCLGLMFPSVVWLRYNHFTLSSFMCSGWKLKDWGESWAWVPPISRGAAVAAIAGRVGEEGIAAWQFGHLLWFVMNNPWPVFYSPGECSNCRIPAYTHPLQRRLCHLKLRKISH